MVVRVVCMCVYVCVCVRVVVYEWGVVCGVWCEACGMCVWSIMYVVCGKWVSGM